MELWRKSENSSNVKPVELDVESSKEWNYVRKDFVLIPATEDVSEHWEYMERKVSKEDWDTFCAVGEHSDALKDVYAALTELAELIDK